MAKFMYVFQGGGYVTASSATEFVNKMWKSSILPEPTIQEYMAGVSSRCMTDSGKYIRHTDCLEFMQDLVAYDYVTEIPTN